MTTGNEAMLWWKVALHLDETQLVLANVMALNVDDPQAISALQEKIREAQGILFDIFNTKGLLPGAAAAAVAPQVPAMPQSTSVALPVQLFQPQPEVPVVVIEESAKEVPAPTIANGSSVTHETAEPEAPSVDPEA